MLRKCLDFLTVPSERFQIQANIARAAAGVGDLDGFYAAWKVVGDAVRWPVEYAAPALINVAEGAYLLNLPRQAVEIASRGIQIARSRNEAAEEQRALKLLERISSGERPVLPTEIPDDVLLLRDQLLELLAKRRE